MKKKTIFLNYTFVIIIGLCLMQTVGCKKDDNNNEIPNIANCGTVTDAAGNVYKTVKIGTQCWLQENLKTTKYRDGSSIPYVSNQTSWSTLVTSAYCYYNNIASNSDSCGLLYNWFALADARNLCPVNWHVPTDAEWTILTTYLGGESVASGKLKEDGYIQWQSPNTGATNETGFTARAGGFRDNNGMFDYIGIHGFWWTNSEYLTDWAWSRDMSSDNSNVSSFEYNKKGGLSVRCLKD